MKSLSFLFSIFSFSILFAQQAPEIEWSNVFGGSDDDEANSVINTSDGGFIVVGSSRSNDIVDNYGMTDGLVVKYNSSNSIEWKKNYGGTNHEILYKVFQTNEGGFLLMGSSSSNDIDVDGNHGGNDIWVVKINEIGNVEWHKCYGGSASESFVNAIETINGYMLIGGTASNDGDVTENKGSIDLWIINIDELGEINWQKTLGGTKVDLGTSIKQTNDGYILAGFSSSNDGDLVENNGMADFWIVKTDFEGDLQWQKNYGGTQEDQLSDVAQTLDGGYLITGQAMAAEGDVSETYGGGDFWVAKLNEIGDIEWENSYGGSGRDVPRAIANYANNTFIIAGESSSSDFDVTNNHGNIDYWLINIDIDGSLLSENSYGGSSDDNGQDLQILDDSCFFVGFSVSDDGDVQVNNGDRDVWIVKLAPDQMSTSEINSNQISIYPNPVKDILKFSEELKNIEIHSLTGLKMAQKKAGSSIQISQFISGIYVLTAETKNGQNVNLKFIKD